MTDLPDSPCDECGRKIIYSRGYFTVGPMHLSCSKTGEPSDWVVENCRFPIPWEPKPDKLEGSQARGWLSPDGRFYGCSLMVHISMGHALARHYYGEEKTDLDLERRKWVHISPDGFSMGTKLDLLSAAPVHGRWDKYQDLSQRQLDALWDWLQTIPPTKEVLTAYSDLDLYFRTLATL